MFVALTVGARFFADVFVVVRALRLRAGDFRAVRVALRFLVAVARLLLVRVDARDVVLRERFALVAVRDDFFVDFAPARRFVFDVAAIGLPLDSSVIHAAMLQHEPAAHGTCRMGSGAANSRRSAPLTVNRVTVNRGSDARTAHVLHASPAHWTVCQRRSPPPRSIERGDRTLSRSPHRRRTLMVDTHKGYQSHSSGNKNVGN